MCGIIFFLERLNRFVVMSSHLIDSILGCSPTLTWLNDASFRFSYGHAHWREFTSQDYFDPHGVFIGGIVAAPVFAILILQLVRATFITYHDRLF